MRQVQHTRNRSQIGPPSDNKPREEVTLDVYETEFEADFLKDTMEYYKRKSQKWTEEDSVPDYLRKAEELYNAEKHRSATYLHPSTEPKLLKAIDTELIGEHQMKLLNSSTGFTDLLERYEKCEGEDDTDLARMYSLFVRLPDSETSGITPIAAMLKEFITQVGLRIVEESSGDKKDHLVPRHVEKFHLFKKLVDKSFKQDHRFQLAMKEAFEKIVNQDVVIKPARGDKPEKTMQTAELMAEYMDCKFKDKTTEDSIWGEMDDVVALFAHLQEKDVFRTFHSELLAKRLLLGKDDHIDWETGFISKLKSLAGAYFTGKMEKMIIDLSLMGDMEESFSNFGENGNKLPFNGTQVKIETKVLTRSNWPNYTSLEMVYPPALQACMDYFTMFYAQNHDKKVLQWIPTLGTAEVILNYVPGKTQPTFSVSIVNAAMLLLFNQQQTMTCAQLYQSLAIPNAEKFLKKYIAHLTRKGKKPELQLLTIDQPAGKSDEYLPTDVLSLNIKGLGKLKWKKKTYKTTLFEMNVDGDEARKAWEKLMKERVMNIDAQIVRIMKNRERMKKGLLVMEVVEGLKPLFPAQAAFVTGRIQVLAEGSHEEGQILKQIADDEYEYVA